MLGVAYEVAAILDTEVKLPQTDYPAVSEQASDYIAVKIEDQEANPLYAAKIIKKCHDCSVTALDANKADECRHSSAQQRC